MALEPELHIVGGWAFFSEDDFATISIGEGQCFCLISVTLDPQIIDMAPGTYEVGMSALAGGEYPCVLILIDSSHAEAFLNIGRDMCDDILAVVTRRQPTAPTPARLQ